MNKSLLSAIERGNLEKVRKMIIQDPSLIEGTIGALILSEVVKTENIDLIRLSIELGASVNDEECGIYDDETPLSIACSTGNLEIVKLLLDSGAWTDTEKDDYESLNPLMCAVVRGNIEIVKLLIERGANVDVIRDGGSTALSIAIDRNYLDIVEYLTPLTTIDIEEIMSRDYNTPCDT